MPLDNADTEPVVDIVATTVLVLLQAPPTEASDKPMLPPTQRETGIGGKIAAGAARTVTTVVAAQVPIV